MTTNDTSTTKKQVQYLSLNELRQTIERLEDAGVVDRKTTPIPKSRDAKIKVIIDALNPPSESKKSKEGKSAKKSKSRWLQNIKIITMVVSSIFLYKYSKEQAKNNQTTPTRKQQLEKAKSNLAQQKIRDEYKTTRKNNLHELEELEEGLRFVQQDKLKLWYKSWISREASDAFLEIQAKEDTYINSIKGLQEQVKENKRVYFKDDIDKKYMKDLGAIWSSKNGPTSKRMATLDEIEKLLHVCSWILVSSQRKFCMESYLATYIRSKQCKEHTQGLKKVMRIRWELFFIDYGLKDYWDGRLTEAGKNFIVDREKELDRSGYWSSYVANQEAQMTGLLGAPTEDHVRKAIEETDRTYNYYKDKDKTGEKFINWNVNNVDLKLFTDESMKLDSASLSKTTRRLSSRGLSSQKQLDTLRFVYILQGVFLEHHEEVKKEQRTNFKEQRKALEERVVREVIRDTIEIPPGKIPLRKIDKFSHESRLSSNLLNDPSVSNTRRIYRTEKDGEIRRTVPEQYSKYENIYEYRNLGLGTRRRRRG